MLGRVQQLGRDLVRTDALGGAVFLVAVSDGSTGADELFRLPLEIGEREEPRLSLDSAQCDALAEDVHAHDFFLAERGHYDLAFLGKALTALDVEFVLVTETAHQPPTGPRDLLRIQRQALILGNTEIYGS